MLGTNGKGVRNKAHGTLSLTVDFPCPECYIQF